jgi:seryl-tRNA synthetase
MWKRVKGNLDSGVEKVKWFSSLLNERVKVEISLFRLLHQSDEMEKQKNALLKTIGERVFELRNDSGQHVLRDPAIQDAVKALEKLDADMEDVRKRASEIEKIEA